MLKEELLSCSRRALLEPEPASDGGRTGGRHQDQFCLLNSAFPLAFLRYLCSDEDEDEDM